MFLQGSVRQVLLEELSSMLCKGWCRGWLSPGRVLDQYGLLHRQQCSCGRMMNQLRGRCASSACADHSRQAASINCWGVTLRG
mgnify:CR=1 FL=1